MNNTRKTQIYLYVWIVFYWLCFAVTIVSISILSVLEYDKTVSVVKSLFYSDLLSCFFVVVGYYVFNSLSGSKNTKTESVRGSLSNIWLSKNEHFGREGFISLLVIISFLHFIIILSSCCYDYIPEINLPYLRILLLDPATIQFATEPTVYRTLTPETFDMLFGIVAGILILPAIHRRVYEEKYSGTVIRSYIILLLLSLVIALEGQFIQFRIKDDSIGLSNVGMVLYFDSLLGLIAMIILSVILFWCAIYTNQVKKMEDR